MASADGAVTDRRVHGRLVAGGAVTLVASMVGAACNLLLLVAVGRGLGPEETGVFLSAVGAFLVVAGALRLGADTGLVRYFARSVAQGRRGELRTLARIALVPALVVGVIVAAILVGAAGPLSRLVFDDQHVADGERAITVLAAFVPLLSLMTIMNAGSRGVGSITSFAVMQNVLLPLGRLVGVAVAIAAGASLVGVLVGWAAVLPVLVVVSAALLRRAIRRVDDGRRAQDDDLSRELPTRFWRFSIPRAVTAVVETAFEWADVILVTALAGPVPGGVYAVASRAVKMVQMVDYASRVAISTRVSAALVHDRRDVVARLYSVATRLMIGLAWPYLVLLALFGPTVLSVFGAGFSEGGTVVVVLAVGMMVLVAAGSIQSILLLGGHSALQLVNKVVALAVLVVGNLLVTPSHGAVGAAAVWCAAIVVDAVLALLQVLLVMRVPLRGDPLLAIGLPVLVTVLPVGVLAVAVLGRSPLALAGAAVLGLAVYAGSLMVTGAPRSLRRLIDTV